MISALIEWRRSCYTVIRNFIKLEHISSEIPGIQDYTLSYLINRKSIHYMGSECAKCEYNFCCILLGERLCSEHRRRTNCFCISCQLYNIEEKDPSEYWQKCSILSEWYSHKYLGKVNGRNSYILQRHCIDHCQLERCPHKDEVTVELHRVIPPPDYSDLIQVGSSSEEINVLQLSVSPQQLESGETPVPCSKVNTRKVPRVTKKNWGGPKGVLADKVARGTRGISRRTRGNRYAGTKYRLSSGSVIGNRSTNCPWYRGM